MYLHFWGKSNKDPIHKLELGAPLYHPAAYHCLDVAACAQALTQARPMLWGRLCQALWPEGIEPKSALAWLGYMAASHDLGKFSDGFQNLNPPGLMEALHGRTSSAPYNERHDVLGYHLLTGPHTKKVLLAWLPTEQARTSFSKRLNKLKPLLRAVMGHHGRPPSETNQADLGLQYPQSSRLLIIQFAQDLQALFHAQKNAWDSLAQRSSEELKRASWLLAGLMVIADWLGSSQAWFPFQHGEHSLEEYWNRFAQPQARRALEESGVGSAKVQASWGVKGLADIETPTPLQRWAEQVELPNVPQIFVLEEVTGGGKTEAAFVLAHRLLLQEQADGIYVALPTMATANAMYERAERFSDRLFEADPPATLVLSHSGQRLESLLRVKDAGSQQRYDRNEESAARVGASWLADGRKKALWAHLGVGTIDQALLGVLPHNHQSLRLSGLATKVLVVDEVHACDTYVRKLLGRLLYFQGSSGGSAILLSATLPQAQREELLRCFAAGLQQRGEMDWPPLALRETSYPLATHLAGPSLHLTEQPLEARASMSRRLDVCFLADAKKAERVLCEAARQDQCACWIRNTVHDAMEAWERLRGLLPEHEVLLFHARFTAGDRNRIEQRVLSSFGKESRHEHRRGRVVIATQVIEQSLDLDFDTMISDLAPADLLLQRAGRLRRHRRDRLGNPLGTPGADERGGALLHILGPQATSEVGEGWYKDVFPKGAFVYPDPGQLWRTARWLQERGCVRVPEDARELIEYVYDHECPDTPLALQGQSQNACNCSVGVLGAQKEQGPRPQKRGCRRDRFGR